VEVGITSSAVLRAAEYVRMSTEHQQYSTQNQSAAIAQYAAAHGMEIVRSYVDAGKSGLKLAGRDALQELIRIVENRRADFDCILVYDISRWGRFQDADESAYYEYLCKRAGISVHYCAEQFQNDNSTTSSLLKSLKRTMAAEFSRELSTKVFAGQCRLIELGFRQGARPGYGLRRQVVDKDGTPKGMLRDGEWKSLQTDRIILVPGPAEEVAIVREIFKLYVDAAKTPAQIADLLNKRGVTRHQVRRWSRGSIRRVLTNPTYMGANVWNRRSFKLKKNRQRNPREKWIWRDAAFEPVVSREQFLRAQAILRSRQNHYSDEELLEKLRRFLARKGVLSRRLIDDADDMPYACTYRRHFGGLVEALKLIGYTPTRDYSWVAANRRIREVYDRQWKVLVTQLHEAGVKIDEDFSAKLITINGEYTASFVLARCHAKHFSTFRWYVNLDSSNFPDIVIVGRMGAANRSPMDYYVVPCLDLPRGRLVLKPENAMNIEVYRSEKLTTFIELARRASIREVA
jgi:DNA invertase Pin-like site-specific DNA recombinase